jgi:hypothetical protein
MDASHYAEVPLFVEEQRFRQWWLWLIMAGPVGVAWYGFWRQLVRGEPFGNNPAPDWAMWLVWLGAGILLPWILYSVALRAEVRPNTVVIRFITPLFPLFRKTIELDRILSVEAVAYRPLREYGGWGIRRGAKGWAYSVSGNRGVRLKMKEGAGVLIGSRQHEQLARAIEQARAESPHRR